MNKGAIKKLLLSNTRAVVRGLMALEAHNLFKKEHKFLLSDLCDWWRENGRFSSAQYQNIKTHLIKYYLGELALIALDKEQKSKGEKTMAKKTVEKKAEKKVESYQELWERLSTEIEAAEAELKAANEKRIDEFVKENGLPPKDSAKLEKLLVVYGFDGIYSEITKIAEKHGLTTEEVEEDATEDDEPDDLDEELDDDLDDDDEDEDDEPEDEPEPPKRKRGRPRKNPEPEVAPKAKPKPANIPKRR